MQHTHPLKKEGVSNSKENETEIRSKIGVFNERDNEEICRED